MMQYNIKAIPTTYNGVNFRSRLEARWAAFFDLCGWQWDYEPFDLDGWAPDFLIKTRLADVLVEVKPLAITRIIGTSDVLHYEKACKHQGAHQVLLLGVCPVENSLIPGSLLEPPAHADYVWDDIAREIGPFQLDWATGEFIDPEFRWREAGNLVQWTAPQDTFDNQMRQIFRKKAAA